MIKKKTAKRRKSRKEIEKKLKAENEEKYYFEKETITELNKQLDKKIERLEGLKEKEKEKINSINQVIAEYDKQLKVLYDLRKEQEKIYQRQQELDLKIKEQQ